jgi:hypothetical protein
MAVRKERTVLSRQEREGRIMAVRISNESKGDGEVDRNQVHNELMLTCK